MFDSIDLYRPPIDGVFVSIVLLAIVFAVVGLYGYWSREVHPLRRVVLLILRLCVLAALAWTLAGPSVFKRGSEPGRVEVLLLADTSASMAETDAGDDGQTSRFNAIQQTWLTPTFLSQLREVADVRIMGFDASAHILSGPQLKTYSPEGTQTLMFQALAEVAQFPRNPITVLLSDGHDTRSVIDTRVMEQLQQTGQSVFAVPVGEVASVADLSVAAWADSDFLFEGQSTDLRVHVIQHGHDHERVRVELLQEGKRISQQTVTFTDEAALPVKFRVSPATDLSPGGSGGPVTLASYVVRVVGEDAAEPETVTENDERHVFVQVSRDRMKIALFEGEPYWDTRYLAQVLRRDPQVDLAAVYQFGRHRQVRVTTGVPGDDMPTNLSVETLTQAQLNSFDVIILGQKVERLFPGQRAAMLVDFVKQRGGALVLARGRAFDRDVVAQDIFSAVEPVTWGERVVTQLKLELTQEGRESRLLKFNDVAPTDVVLAALPGMMTATRIEREKAASLVLLRQQALGDKAAPMAAVVHQRVGRGQVMAVLGEGLWRWALLPPEQVGYESVYALFWSRAVRWLATGGEFLPGQQVSMTLDRLSVEPGKPVTATIATRYVESGAFKPTLRLIGPTGEVQTITPKRDALTLGGYRAVLEPTATGLWRVELFDAGDEPSIAPTAPVVSRFAVHDRSLERLTPSARPRVLKQLTDATHGQCWAIDDTDALLDQIEQVRVARKSDVRATYDFNRGWVFAVIAIGLMCEWVLRRRGGLL